MVPADEAWSWFSFELQTFSSVKYLMKMLHKIGFIDPKLIQIVKGLNRWGVSTCLGTCICVWECVFMCLMCYQTGFSLVCLCVLHWELFTHLGSLKYKIPGLFLKFWIWNRRRRKKDGWGKESGNDFYSNGMTLNVGQRCSGVCLLRTSWCFFYRYFSNFGLYLCWSVQC